MAASGSDPAKVADGQARRTARRERADPGEKKAGAIALSGVRLEQLQHPVVVGALLAGQVVRHQPGQVKVAHRHSIRIA
jgi:hypothetical protein